MSQEPLVPDDFEAPRELRAAWFRLEPLGPQHNAADLDIVLRQAVRVWLAEAWPFDEVVYSG